jgi:LacI family transcriptional regulator
VLVSDLHNPFFPMVLDGIDAVAEEHEYTSLVVSGKRRSQTEEHALGRLLELQVDGIVAVTERLSRAAVVEAARSAPLVMLTQTPRIPRVDTVVSDNREGAKLVIDHLVALGHTGIAMIADAREHAGAERIDGYQAAMNGHRLARQVRVVNAPPTERGGYNATRELLSDAGPVTAVFAGNDLCAFGVLDALAEHGLRVPADMSVAGYDNTPVAALRTVSLTTVEQFATEIGAEAVAQLRRGASGGGLGGWSLAGYVPPSMPRSAAVSGRTGRGRGSRPTASWCGGWALAAGAGPGSPGRGWVTRTRTR